MASADPSLDHCAELLAPGERRSVRYRDFGGPLALREHRMHRVSESWPALASRGATPGREPNIPAPGLGVFVRGRKSLAQSYLRRRCARFCGPKKEDRDRSGVLTRTDLRSLIPRSRFLDPSAWRASGRGALCAPPILPFRPGHPRLAAPAVEPCGPSSPVRVCRDSPSPTRCLRVSRSGLRLRIQPSGSGGRKVRAVVPPWPVPRLAPPNRSLCGPPSRGLPASLSADMAPLGVLRRSTGRVSRRSPRSVCR